MLAASYWSLLAPAIDMAEDSGKYGSFAFVPVAVGFTLGAAFVYFADLAMPFLVGTLTHTVFYVSWRAQKYSCGDVNVAGADQFLMSAYMYSRSLFKELSPRTGASY